jgi:hypothetical protein
LLPFYQDKAWPYEQIAPMTTIYERLIPLLKRVAKVYQQKQYTEILMQLPVNLASERTNLLYP